MTISNELSTIKILQIFNLFSNLITKINLRNVYCEPMKQIDITKDKILKQKVVLALGYFDCVHIGHRAIITQAQRLAEQYKAKTVIMSFADCEFSQVVKKQKSLYTYEQRTQLFADLGVNYVLPFLFEQIRNYSAEQFLQLIFCKLNIKAVICGYDFRFGQKGKGDVQLLDKHCRQNRIELNLVSSELYQGIRVSTTQIRQFLNRSDFVTANAMLGQPYFISGQVVKGREEGRKNGQPTANIIIDDNYFCLPQGVYGTKITISDGFIKENNQVVYKQSNLDNAYINNEHMQLERAEYKAITNIGGKPTYGIEAESIESLLINFDCDIYDKTITLKFYKKIRDVKKFDSIPELITQIEKDKQWC